MRILRRLREEHRLIERVAGSLAAFAETTRQGASRGETLRSFCAFFEGFVDRYHHAKEEEILLPALIAAPLPESGPIAMLRGEHAENRVTIASIRALAEPGRRDGAAGAALAAHYCARLWEHIDKEDSVLFGEVEVRLALEAGRLDSELDAFEARTGDLASLAELGASLVERFPPRTELPGVMRGDGCVMCRHYGDGCQGIEREWWSELEWEDFWARNT